MTVVTARTRERLVGFTASAFTSVSLAPPLVLVCIGRSSSAHDPIAASPRFGVSILAAGQGELARQFARPGVDRFRDVRLRAGFGEVPILDGALGWLVCARHALHAAGDHSVLVGEVMEAGVDEAGEPLVHYGRRFGEFVASARATPPAALSGGEK